LPYTTVGSRSESGREGTNRTELGTARPSAVRGGTLRRAAAVRAGAGTIAQVTRGRRLRAGTYVLEVAALDATGRVVSRKHFKFWVMRAR